LTPNVIIVYDGIVAVFAMLGMLSPASRGSLMSAGLFLYCFMGLIAGYYAGRLYKTLRGVQAKRAALQVFRLFRRFCWFICFQTGILFPAVILGSGFLLNFFLIGKHSSGAVSFIYLFTVKPG
jgi:transmembrane 9 superfamily protein 2/4